MQQARGRCLRLGSVGVAALLLTTGAPAHGHDFFLIPDTSSPEARTPFGVGMHVSDVFPGEPEPWRQRRTRRFFLVDARGRLSLKDAPLEGNPAKASVTLRAGGSVVIALTTEPSTIELQPDEFEAYLRHEGQEEILSGAANAEARPELHRERYTRYVKTLVHASGEVSAVALENLGLPIEIVPEAQPAELRPGDRLPVRAFFEGRPYAGGYLCATHAGHSQEHDAYAWCGRLDGSGRAQVPIRAPGWQLVRITRLRPAPADDGVDWESFWAALTFEVLDR